MARLIAASILMLAFAIAAPTSAADRGPDKAARLMRQLKAASGGAALDQPDGFHETGTVVRDGQSGTYEYWGDLRALRSVGSHTLAGATVIGGFDGKTTWSVDPNGKVLIDSTPRGLSGARLGTYLSIGGYFYPDRFPASFAYRGRRHHGAGLYDVVAVTPQGGDTAELWLDSKTHRLARLVGDADGIHSEGEILSYQVVDGTWIGFGLRTREGEHRMAQQLVHYVYGPVDPARFSAPEPSAAR
jgi:hypothetical protein